MPAAVQSQGGGCRAILGACSCSLLPRLQGLTTSGCSNSSAFPIEVSCEEKYK